MRITNTTLSTEVIATTTQTPIEVALQIDEDGMTTASNLYTFLELDPTHFSRWRSKNIISNKFATENKDYFALAIHGERYNPNPKTDYKLTSDFAKKLSMTGNTERHEQARQYFLACEKGLRIATAKLQSTQLDMRPLTDAITNLTNSMSIMQQEVQSLKESKHSKYLSEKRYPSAWYRKMAPKYKMLMEYFGCSRKELYLSIYKELEDTYDVDVNQIHEDYCFENRLSASEVFPMDAIEHNRDLRDAITLLIDLNLIRFGLQTEDEIKNFRRTTLFS